MYIYDCLQEMQTLLLEHDAKHSLLYAAENLKLSEEGFTNVVALLIASKADVNEKDRVMYMHPCIYSYIYVCIYSYIYIHIYTYLYIYIYIYTYVFICVYKFLSRYMDSYACMINEMVLLIASKAEGNCRQPGRR